MSAHIPNHQEHRVRRGILISTSAPLSETPLLRQQSRCAVRQVELVETTGGLDALAESANEIVWNTRVADAGQHVLLNRDCGPGH